MDFPQERKGKIEKKKEKDKKNQKKITKQKQEEKNPQKYVIKSSDRELDSLEFQGLYIGHYD